MAREAVALIQQCSTSGIDRLKGRSLVLAMEEMGRKYPDVPEWFSRARDYWQACKKSCRLNRAYLTNPRIGPTKCRNMFPVEDPDWEGIDDDAEA